MNYTCEIDSPIGRLKMSSDGSAITGLWLEGQKYFAASLPADAIENNDLSIFAQARSWLTRYFAGENPPLDLPLRPGGTPYRQRVWELLKDIPYGETASYGQIAAQLTAETGQPTAARAVGGAVGHNPISILIPCHRVVGALGGLTGYAGGLDAKARLLALEGSRTN